MLWSCLSAARGRSRTSARSASRQATSSLPSRRIYAAEAAIARSARSSMLKGWKSPFSKLITTLLRPLKPWHLTGALSVVMTKAQCTTTTLRTALLTRSNAAEAQ